MALEQQLGDTGALDLLPALPTAWPDGAVTGLRARGGFTVDLAWRAGRLTAATVHAARAVECRVRSAQPLVVEDGPQSHPTQGGHELRFRASAGASYTLRPPA
jgi:alpha-L-fucosidase 2